MLKKWGRGKGGSLLPAERMRIDERESKFSLAKERRS